MLHLPWSQSTDGAFVVRRASCGCWAGNVGGQVLVYKDALDAVAVLHQSSELDLTAAVRALCSLLAEGAGFEEAPRRTNTCITSSHSPRRTNTRITSSHL